ncbi:MAG TPA: NTP transferase domain-containing protein, partial [Candidatus Acidoferrales bacterium]|nr:NTP transferase domain-containing protein [Candidatus Acidoferrales bacterium]
MPLTAVILAAGAGSRLGELAMRYSKATVPVAGRPLIYWITDMLSAAGVEQFVIVGHPSDSRLAEIMNELDRATLVIQRERRGIADALHCALPAVNSEPAFLACACDSLYPVTEVETLIDRGRANLDDAIVGVLEMGRAATASRSVVQTDGEQVTQIVEKPVPGSVDSGLVALPLYWLPQRFMPYCSYAAANRGETYVSTALNRFLLSGGTLRAVAFSRRLEVTTPEDLQSAATELAQPSSL